MNIAKRLLAVVVTLLLALSLAVIVSVPADAAARKRRVDHRPCISEVEYLAIRRNMTGYQVRALVDRWGTEVVRVDNGYYDGAWVEDGYWNSTWVDASYYVDGYYDENGVWVDGYWVDDGYYDEEWVDASYYDETGGPWVSVVDTYRTYRKCNSFQRGRGRVVVNFDDYSSPYSGLRVYTKINTRTWSGYGRTTEGLPEKNTPSAPARPARPSAPSQSEAPHTGDHRADSLAKAKEAGATLVVK